MIAKKRRIHNSSTAERALLNEQKYRMVSLLNTPVALPTTWKLPINMQGTKQNITTSQHTV